MKNENRKFALLVLGICALTIAISIGIQTYKQYFEIAEFPNISSILQGTLGIAVSLAGAIVAVRLATISMIIVEKEKQREESKLFHEIVENSIRPIRDLSISIQELYNVSFAFKYLFTLSKDSGRILNDTKINADLANLRNEVISVLEKMILAVQDMSHNIYSSALWISVTDKRLSEGTMLLKGGAARSSNNRERSQENGYLIEDLNMVGTMLKTDVVLFWFTLLRVSKYLTSQFSPSLPIVFCLEGSRIQIV